VLKRPIFAALCVLLVLPAESALAYQDRGLDPDDRAAVGLDPDIRSTVRSVWTTEGGGRVLRVRVRAYDRLGIYWYVIAYLDSRGGPRADYVMRFRVDTDHRSKECNVNASGHPGSPDRGWLRQRGDTATCRVPASLVHPTKRIRWRLRSPSGYGRNTDVAPNGGGWYG
jgi:hypothetical protein